MNESTIRLNEDELLFVPLGGCDEIGMNLNLFHACGRWLMVDCGINFAGEGLAGVDLLLPDPGFIVERRDALEALVLTHGHEDHIGAVAQLWPRLRCPIYATPFTAALVRGKLAEAGLAGEAEIREVPVGGTLETGPFRVRYVPLAHSIAEGHGLLIETPLGRVFHTGDWKLDHAPQIGAPSTPAALEAIGDAGVRAMIGDSTNVFNPRASGSEEAVRESLMDLLHMYSGRVVVTTFASNLARLKTVAAVARAHGRALCVAGRSLDRVIAAGRATGWLDDWPRTVAIEDAMALPRDRLLILCTGAQGEPRAALSRMARGEHARLFLEPGDVVIFSAKIIPGNELSVARVVNQLARRDVDVVTERDAFVHVSGHPGREELAEMYRWIRPEVAVPVHGEPRHLREHAAFARSLGVKEAVVPFNGAVIRLAPGPAEIVGEVPARRLAVDGRHLTPLDGEVLAMRRRIGAEGLMTVGCVLGRGGRPAVRPDLRDYGIPGLDEEARLEIEALVVDLLESASPADDLAALGERIRIAVRRRLRALSGKNPQVDVRVSRTA